MSYELKKGKRVMSYELRVMNYELKKEKRVMSYEL